jgi:hypothetical protein
MRPRGCPACCACACPNCASLPPSCAQPAAPTCGPQQRALLQYIHHLLPAAHLALIGASQADAATRHLADVNRGAGPPGAQQVVDLLLQAGRQPCTQSQQASVR